MVDKVLAHEVNPKVIRVVLEGVVRFGEIETNCAVLNDKDETTVFTMRALESTLKMPRPKGYKSTGNQGLIVGDLLPSFMRVKAIKTRVNKDLSLATFKPIKFALKKGGTALGFPAKLIPNLIRVWVEALDAGALTEPQRRIAQTLQAMGTAASSVGVIGIIHESLGYQEKRKKALVQLFTEIFEEQTHPWAHEFSIEFYEHIYRLTDKMYDWEELLRGVNPENKPQTPSWIGRVTRDIIYSRLKPKGILDILEKRNPTNQKGIRKNRHHMHLTKQQGLKILHTHLGRVELLMKQHKKWQEFYAELDTHFPVQDGQDRFKFMGEEIESVSDKVHPKLI